MNVSDSAAPLALVVSYLLFSAARVLLYRQQLPDEMSILVDIHLHVLKYCYAALEHRKSYSVDLHFPYTGKGLKLFRKGVPE